MRKRKYLIAMGAALVASVAVAAVAVAGPLQGQTLRVEQVTVKQDAKKRGATSIKVNVDTAYAPVGTFTPKATRTQVDFDKDFAFSAGTLPPCQPTQLTNTTTEQAIAVCGRSQVGTGASTVSGPATLNGVVTAFNGPTVGGNQTILLHNRIAAPLNNTTVLTGVLGPSTGGPQFGKTLDVTVPILPGGFVITHFDTAIGKKVVKKGKTVKKGNKRVKKPNTYYVSARCSKGQTWDFGARSEYRNNAAGPVVQTTSATSTVKCKAKKKKKKKK